MNLHLDERGPRDGEPMVFLHGLGIGSWMWTDQIEVLSDEFRCITIDLPGTGMSRHVGWVSLAHGADGVAETIRRACPGGAHIVGLSFGGYLALVLAERHPDVVRSIAVSGVTAEPMRPRPLYRLVLAATSRLTRLGPVVKVMARLMNLPDDARQAYLEEAAALETRMVRSVYAELLDFEAPRSVKRLLVAAGERDTPPVRRSLATFRRLFPEADVVVAPAAHHGWNGEHPELFTQMIRSHALGLPLPSELRSLAPEPAGSGRPSV